MVFAVSFALYTLAIVALGVYSTRFSKKTDEDYFLAGRSLGPWVAALSASASSESGWVTLGLVGMAFRTGVTAYWIIPGCLLGFVFNWFVLAGRMRDRSAALGAVAGFPAARLVASHYALMARDTSQVLVAGPAVVERALGEKLSKEELGGAQVHGRNGVVDDGYDNGINDVNVERESTEMVKNELAFRLATRLLGRTYRGMRMAVTGQTRG